MESANAAYSTSNEKSFLERPALSEVCGNLIPKDPASEGPKSNNSDVRNHKDRRRQKSRENSGGYDSAKENENLPQCVDGCGTKKKCSQKSTSTPVPVQPPPCRKRGNGRYFNTNRGARNDGKRNFHENDNCRRQKPTEDSGEYDSAKENENLLQSVDGCGTKKKSSQKSTSTPVPVQPPPCRRRGNGGHFYMNRGARNDGKGNFHENDNYRCQKPTENSGGYDCAKENENLPQSVNGCGEKEKSSQNSTSTPVPVQPLPCRKRGNGRHFNANRCARNDGRGNFQENNNCRRQKPTENSGGYDCAKENENLPQSFNGCGEKEKSSQKSTSTPVPVQPLPCRKRGNGRHFNANRCARNDGRGNFQENDNCRRQKPTENSGGYDCAKENENLPQSVNGCGEREKSSQENTLTPVPVQPPPCRKRDNGMQFNMNRDARNDGRGNFRGINSRRGRRGCDTSQYQQYQPEEASIDVQPQLILHEPQFVIGVNINNTVYFDTHLCNAVQAQQKQKLCEAIRYQVEYYFSEVNLLSDRYLRLHMDKQGFVDVALIANFHRLRHICSDVNVIIEALKDSSKLELSDDGKVRPVDNPLSWILDEFTPGYFDPYYHKVIFPAANTMADLNINGDSNPEGSYAIDSEMAAAVSGFRAMPVNDGHDMNGRFNPPTYELVYLNGEPYINGISRQSPLNSMPYSSSE